MFFFYNIRERKGKGGLVNFPTFIAVTLEHIRMLITPARKLRGAQKYILIGCAQIKGTFKFGLPPIYVKAICRLAPAYNKFLNKALVTGPFVFLFSSLGCYQCKRCSAFRKSVSGGILLSFKYHIASSNPPIGLQYWGDLSILITSS